MVTITRIINPCRVELGSMATPEGTRGFDDGGYRRFERGGDVVKLSKVGVGTYLGDAADEVDSAYVDALETAFEMACNVVDTASNYRHGRSEECVGEAVDGVDRDEVFVASKAGYIPFDREVPDDPEEFVRRRYVDPGVVDPGEVVDANCISPEFLEHQVDGSLRRLDIDSVDLYYVHNPECHLKRLDEREFYRSLRRAFEKMEEMVERGVVDCYGVATWKGFRVPQGRTMHLSMERVVEEARLAASGESMLCAVQMPYNRRMDAAVEMETQVVAGEEMTALEAAEELGLYVFGSASLMQGELARGRSDEEVRGALAGACSADGVDTALFGSSDAGHVRSNLGLLGE